MLTLSQIRRYLCLALWAILPLAAPAQSPGQTVIFQQPDLDGIGDNFHVPISENRYPTDHAFNLVLWQPNPNRPDGQLVPSHRSVADKTGFQPAGALEAHQVSFRDGDEETTLQIQGDTVGVYLDSRDLPNHSPGDKMMITPAFRLPKDQHLFPFEQTGVAMVNSLELQIPVARDTSQPGNITYATSDLVFEDRQSHAKISYGVNLFHHTPRPMPPMGRPRLIETEVGVYDAPSHSFQVGNPLAVGSRVVSILAGSALHQDQPWSGWRLFKFAITQNNFRTALQSAKAKSPDFAGSDNPADYAFIEWHLNAELKFATGPAALGWSMRRASIILTPENQLRIVGQ